MVPFLLAVMSQSRPVAYVLEHEDQWTKSAQAATELRRAGFEVKPLPLGGPLQLDRGIVVFGSFSCEIEGYGQFVERNKSALLDWVAQGNVLLQFTQADQYEPSPPFLPSGTSLQRADPDYSSAFVANLEHPLMQGVGGPQISFHSTRTVWETISDQRGMVVLMTAQTPEGAPAMVEGAVGRGRVLFTSLPLDKTIAPIEGQTEAGEAALKRFRAAFFSNLASYVDAVRGGLALPVVPTPSQSELRAVEPGSWSLIAMPDTQIYAESFPGIFYSQTSWIVLNKERLDVRYVLHLGDVTNRNTPEQWTVAKDAMSQLDGVVPYAIAPGNHDFGPGGNARTRQTFFNEYFPFDRQASMPSFGGAYRRGQLENTYHLFEAGGRKWIVIALEWGPRDSVVEWADQVMSRHADRTGILVTHAYVYSDSTRYDWRQFADHQHWNPHAYDTEGGVNDGEELWQKLVKKHNFAFAINGHVLNDGTGYVASKNEFGLTVHQVLANYQFRTLGGEGYLRIFEFSPDGKSVRIKAYSTLYDRFMTAPDQSFVVTLDQPMGPVALLSRKPELASSGMRSGTATSS
jgi:3',5'-cyclic AMP phosphodiesterase CpdA